MIGSRIRWPVHTARAVSGAALVLLSCRPAPPTLAPVPDRSQRLELAIPDEKPLADAAVQNLLDQIVCLVGSNARDAELCEGEETRESVPLCTTKAVQMTEPLRAVLKALPNLELTTLDSALVEVPRLLPGVRGHATRA